MFATLVFLTIAGNVALLLWGLHMVHSGLVRAFGAALRRVLALGFDRPWKALLAGCAITALMQSSNATGLMASGFVAARLVGLVPALAAMLGANIGTTLIVQLLSFNAAAAAPILILAGFISFKHGQKTHIRDLGRVGIGLGLVLVALSAIVAAIEPLEHAEAVGQILAGLSGDAILNVLLGAALAWAAHSSVVVVLLVMAFAGAHVVGPAAAIAFVLGANLGTAMPQVMAAGNSAAARQLAAGNLLIKGLGCLVALAALPFVADNLPMLSDNAPRQIALVHLAFNLVLAVAFFPLLDRLSGLLTKLIPVTAQLPDSSVPRYLTASSDPPGAALANGEREVLRLVNLVNAMLRATGDAIDADDRKKLGEVASLDDAIDRLHRAVKDYLIEFSRRSDLNEADLRRCSELLTFTINLEHVGDILDRSLRALAAKKIKNQLTFSRDGRAEIGNMQANVLHQLSLAVGVLMTGDPRVARTLVNEKLKMRDLEEEALRNHLERLREGRSESIETSTLHLDIIRDLKRITAHLAYVAYPVLEPIGAVRRSRLIEQTATGTEHPLSTMD